MNNKTSLVIFIFIVAVQIKLLLAENHCSKSAVMNIIMEQCSRQKRNTQYFFNHHEATIPNSNTDSQERNHRIHKRKLRRRVMAKFKVGRYLFQVPTENEELSKRSLSNNDMDEILELVRRTPRSYRSKDEIIRNVAICCQDIESCRKNASIITCP